MDEKRVTEEIKRIKSKTNLTKAIVIIMTIALMLLPIKTIFKIAVMLVAVVLLIAITSKIQSRSLTILYDDCDAGTFYEVCRGVYPQGSVFIYEALAAFFIGDFEGSVRLASSMLNKKQNVFSRFEFTSLLVDNSFAAGDYEMCVRFCNEAIELLDKIKITAEEKKEYICHFDFFKAFISGDYSTAIARLDEQNTISQTALKNSAKLMRCYYFALAHYYDGDIERSGELFETITKAAPKFFITEKSEQYIHAINSDTFIEISSYSLSEAYEQGRVTEPKSPVNKTKKMRSLIIMITLIIIAFVFIMQIPGIESGTAYDVISSDVQVNEICKIVPLDEKYTLCIFDTEYDDIGVAYLKNKSDNEYVYCISYVTSPKNYTYEDNGYYINANGNAPKVYFDITDNTELIPENSQVTEFESNGKSYYFYITKTEIKNNFGNTAGALL